MNRKNVLVIGGGIGGMATAIRLRQAGIGVHLIDIDPHWRVYGAGITITGATMRAFRRLGILDDIEREGAFMSGRRTFLYDGTFLEEVEEPPIEPGLPSAGGIMRPVLHRLLSDRVRAAGVRIDLGMSAQAIDNRADEVEVRFSDGSRGHYDLVVGADGIYSATRGLLFPDAVEPRYTGQGSWRIVADRPAGMNKAQFFVGHENMVGMVAVSRTQIYVFILNPDPDRKRIAPEDQPAEVRRLLADFGGDIAPIRDTVNAGSSIVYRPLESALQPRPWNRRRVVLIGDAVHATTPHLASGAGSAVEDAMVLGEELTRPGIGVEEALAAYTERRYERCRQVVERSVAIGEHQLAHGPMEGIGAMMGEAYGVLAQDY